MTHTHADDATHQTAPMSTTEPVVLRTAWHETTIAPDRTHHLLHGRPLYDARFDHVLKFHPPGLAPVSRAGQAWHIEPDGTAAYGRRFRQTFGFYEGKAAVTDVGGGHHILPDGSDLYVARYAWCGNFQEGRCTVRTHDGRYLHLTAEGAPAYPARWRYAGDFRDSVAVVQADDGRSTHIDPDGHLVHGQWFHDLDVYHKGFARARDARGWTHVDIQGRPIYARRFAAVEPFYNGQARVECFDGRLEVIGEDGNTRVVLRDRAPGPAWDGAALGAWPVREEIARGSSGAIYASAPGAVIKSTSNLGAWAREGEILDLLEGRGAPRLLDAFTRAGTGYLVLERIHGSPLGSRNRTKARPLPAALTLVRSLLNTLARLHTAGWVHTDIHPGNVLDVAGQATLLDPAHAVRLDSSRRWHGEVHWGRWEFIPPEQFEGFTTLDTSADTYAVCALLAYLVSGHTPFQVDVSPLRREGWTAVRNAFINTRTTPNLEGVPSAVRDIVARGLAPEPESRFEDAAVLLKALEVFDV